MWSTKHVVIDMNNWRSRLKYIDFFLCIVFFFFNVSSSFSSCLTLMTFSYKILSLPMKNKFVYVRNPEIQFILFKDPLWGRGREKTSLHFLFHPWENKSILNKLFFCHHKFRALPSYTNTMST